MNLIGQGRAAQAVRADQVTTAVRVRMAGQEKQNCGHPYWARACLFSINIQQEPLAYLPMRRWSRLRDKRERFSVHAASNVPPPAAGSAPVEIRIDGVTKSFGGKAVLRGIDLTIRRGELVAIVGGSGCGKTVLLNHVLGQLEPDSGRIFVANHTLAERPLVDLADIDDLHISGIHQHWGVVFQRNALFSGTVLDNIALWLREVRDLDEAHIVPIAEACLAAVSLPNDGAFLNTETASLSGGMAKRLAIARAISMNPATMFYDEPTTGLDPTSALQIQTLIRATHGASVPGGIARTTLIITHDKDLLIRLRPRIIMLHDGKVSFDGSFDDFHDAASAIIRPYFDLMPILHERQAQ